MTYRSASFYSAALLLIFTSLGSYRSNAQEVGIQFALGTTRSFLPKNRMSIGQVGLAQIPQTTIWIDFNRTIQRSGKKLVWGLSASINHEKFLYTIDRPLPYFTPERERYLFLAAGINNVEVHGYLARRFDLYRSEKWRIGLLPKLGPVFHINPFPIYTDASTNLRNNGTAFRLYEIYFQRPSWYVPYMRGTLSLELIRRFRSGLEVGVSPMLSFAAFSNDKALFVTVPDDPINRSLGSFRINRGFTGITILIGK